MRPVLKLFFISVILVTVGGTALAKTAGVAVTKPTVVELPFPHTLLPPARPAAVQIVKPAKACLKITLEDRFPSRDYVIIFAPEDGSTATSAFVKARGDQFYDIYVCQDGNWVKGVVEVP